MKSDEYSIVTCTYEVVGYPLQVPNSAEQYFQVDILQEINGKLKTVSFICAGQDQATECVNELTRVIDKYCADCRNIPKWN